MKMRIASSIVLLILSVANLSATAAIMPENPVDHSCRGEGTERAGAVQQLAKVVNSRDDSFHCVGLTLKVDAISAIRFETHRFSGAQRQIAEPVKVEEFPIGQIESLGGAVLEGQPGHDAIILQGRFARPSITADLNIRYLHNGITGQYRSCQVTLGRGADARWHLTNARHQDVELISVRTWALPLVGTAGIANLDGVCQAG